MIQKPEMTVIIPLYNNRKYVRDAVLSVLAEKIERLEVIVVDDASTDGGAETLADLDVCILRQPRNLGSPAACNRAVRASQGQWITFLDSDDILAEGGLRWRVDYLRAHPEESAVIGRPAGIIDEEGREFPLAEFPGLLHSQFVVPERLSLDFFQSGGVYVCQMWNLLLRRELMERVGPFNEEFVTSHDVEYMMRLLSAVTIPVVFRPEVYRRLHSTNISVDKSAGQYRLNDRAIDECLRALAPYGIQPTEWYLWERGFQR